MSSELINIYRAVLFDPLAFAVGCNLCISVYFVTPRNLFVKGQTVFDVFIPSAFFSSYCIVFTINQSN